MRIHGNQFDPAQPVVRSMARRVFLLCMLIVIAVIIQYSINRGFIRPYMAPTYTPTRSVESFLLEGRSFFASGQLDLSIQAYQNATAVDRKNPTAWIELSRIESYSSAVMLSSDKKKERLDQAIADAKTALSLDPNNGLALAVHALALDWSADPNIYPSAEERTKLLNLAYQQAIAALQRAPNDPLASAYLAEVLVDQTNWSEALDVAAKAVQLGPNEMDTHRVYGYVFENNAMYQEAIEQYQLAIKINPNLPFLHMRLGAQYRHLGELNQMRGNQEQARELISLALQEFDRASQLNTKDPLPFLSIANTYANQGEFFIAEINARKALSLDPADPLLYGQLGTIYYKAKNYETALIVLKCAVEGCSAKENEEQGQDVQGAALVTGTLAYYYTYGSVLAFYAECDRAATIFATLRASPLHDQLVEEIIQEGERICANAALSPTATPVAGANGGK
jgi:tetratricopeptide (TPR) repeat protein